MTLRDMALSRAEQKKDSPVAVSSAGKQRFPWGLSLSLDAVALKKLGREEGDFEPGAMVDVVCKARCTGKDIHEAPDDSRICVTLQIETMEVLTEDDKAAKAFDRIFGDGR